MRPIESRFPRGIQVSLSRVAAALCVAVLLVGCKIEITVPQGGSVVTSSGAYTCFAGQTCLVSVYDIHFDETFSVTAEPGYQFAGWKKQDRGLCGGSSDPCRLFTSSFEGQPNLMAVLESDEVFYLEPVFEPAPEQNHLLLYGGAYSDYFIGCISCEDTHVYSICNSAGSYGSRYSADSIWNERGDFGASYSNTSPWNQFAGVPPVVRDSNGQFYGYLTANPLYPSRTTNAVLVQLTDLAADGRYTLNSVRNWFCD